jgi:hypothetical protein
MRTAPSAKTQMLFFFIRIKKQFRRNLQTHKKIRSQSFFRYQKDIFLLMSANIFKRKKTHIFLQKDKNEKQLDKTNRLA